MTKKNFFYSILMFIVLASCKTLVSNNKNIMNDEEEENGIALQDRMDLAWQQEKEMTKDPALGNVPTDRLIPAWQYTKQNLAQRTNAAIANMNWISVGPKNWGGRSRAICIDLNDATRKTVFVGSVGGGLWKTTDITATEPNWQAVNETFGNLAITSIAQDPSNTQTLYFSTGEGYNNSDAIRGLGIWKSTDGGATWNQLSSTNNSNFYYCQKILVNNSGVIFVATRNGLYRSTNGGTNFTKVLGTGLSITGAVSNVCYDVEIASNEVIYSSLSGSLHKSTDGGLTWSSSLPIGITASRIEVATAPSNANTLYILCESSSAVSGIAVSTDAGSTFTTKTEPADADPGIPATDFSRTQAWYDLTIAVDPNNEATIYVGGVDLFKSTNSGTSWQQISHWTAGYGFQYAHADQHNITFSPGSSSIIYFLNDGGIFRTSTGTNAIPTISSKNTNYNTLQFYACAMSPVSGTYNFLAGAQDNGSHKFTTAVIQNSTQVTGGDGAFCHIDQTESQYWFTSYVYNNYYRSSDGGNTFSSASYGNSGRFINPTDYDDNANIMYAANGNNEYLRWDNPQTGTTFNLISITNMGGTASAIKVSPNTSNRVFFGTGSGTIVKVDNANTATPTSTLISTGLPSYYISCIEVENGNDNHLLVTFSNYGVTSIWETTNGGTNWTSVEGNLPDMPVRWVLFNPNNNDQAVVATDLGVWSTDNLNGTSTVWGASNNGLANVRVDMLQVRNSDKLLIAATHGRGLFYSGVFAPATANFSPSAQITYTQKSIQFTNTSFNATSYNWDFGDGTFSTSQNPTKQYNTQGVYNVSLSINGGVSTIIKSIKVLPYRSTPYTISLGGNFETNTGDFAAETITGTGWELGSSSISGKNGTNSGSNAWVTSLTSNYVDNSTAYLYTPNYNFNSVGTYNFSFYTKYNCEANYDGFRVEYSTNKGDTWLPLGTTVATNWYNFANTSNTTAFPTGEAFFSGSFGTAFVKQNFDISFLSGNANVAFRFAFKTDAGVTGAGVALDDVEITGPANVVPLNLLYFTANKTSDNKSVVIKWQTAQELDVANYFVERSFNGIEFKTIQQVTPHNIFSITQNYTVNDYSIATANPVAYYRLKAIDKNGTTKLSAAVKLIWENNADNIMLSPNPFFDRIYIQSKEKVESVSLINTEGKIVFSTNNIQNGTVFVPAVLTKGNYWIKIITNQATVVKTLSKQ